jgi:WD40 repeat protein
MKKIFLMAFSILCISQINAQTSFSWIPNDTIVMDVDPNNYTEMLIEQMNVTNDTIQLEVEVVYNDVPATWDGMICLYGQCLGSIQPVGFVGIMDPIFDSVFGYTKLTVYPAGGTESIMLRLRVYDVNNPTDGDTCTWIVNSVATTSISENLISNLTVYPNPTTDYLTVSNSSDFNAIKLFDIQGKKVLNNTFVLTTEKQVELNGLSSGIYMLNTYNDNVVVGTQKVTINE